MDSTSQGGAESIQHDEDAANPHAGVDDHNGLDPEEAEMLSDLARHHASNDGYTFGDGTGLNDGYHNDHDHANGGHAPFPDLELLLCAHVNASTSASDSEFDREHHPAGLDSEQNTHLSTALPHDQGPDHQHHGGQDLPDLDPAALLESLATFEHPPANDHNELSISNDHFASLLRAAATATGDELYTASNAPSMGQLSNPTKAADANGRTPKKRRRNDQQTYEARVPQFFLRNSSRKKQRIREDEEQLEKEREIWGSEIDEAHEEDEEQTDYQGPPVRTSDAKAAGVHSATALFRKPSNASKKYTRPPMSKLFTSLELPPEIFLELQGAAKKYMLHPDHPERRDSVGNRGRGDADMVKLKLFSCVKAFLEDEDWGQRCWGEGTDPTGTRKLHWPQTKNRITALVTPLLRRMVTNERQRQYAVETRKVVPGSPPPPKAKWKKTRDHSSTPISTNEEYHDMQQASSRVYPEYPNEDRMTNNPNIDPNLDRDQATPLSPPHNTIPQNQIHPSHHQTAHHQEAYVLSIDPSVEPTFPQQQEASPPTTYHVSILRTTTPSTTTTLKKQTRILPTLYLTPHTCPNFPSLVQHIHNLLATAPAPPPPLNTNKVTTPTKPKSSISTSTNNNKRVKNPHNDEEATSGEEEGNDIAADVDDDDRRRTLILKRIAVLLPTTGLTEVRDEEGWRDMVRQIEEAEWMEGVVRVVGEVEGGG